MAELDGFNHRRICATKDGGRTQVEPAYDFPFDEVADRIDGREAEEDDAFARLGDGLIAILAFIISDCPNHPDSAFTISARALALAYQLRPELVAPFKSLQDIATHCAVSRQSLSDALLLLLDTTGATLRRGKRESSRETYKESARAGWRKRIARLQAQGAAK